jgi:2-C-methyl-D-erythritol 4-phosphate cytidylyltransferase/2-C-methyl-D-erythritol 2,4-cyclodiphosphate synthase
MMFPPENPKIKGISSREIVAAVMEKVARKKAIISHVDVNILAEEPKIKPHYAAIRDSVASLLEVPATSVNIKAKTHEGLDSIGEGRAMACQAVASILIPMSLS